MALILIILVSLLSQIQAEQEQCYADLISPYLSFGGNMAYMSSRGSQIYVPQNCTPIYVWGIIRHGTRYPVKKSFIKKVQKTLPKIRDEIILNHQNGRGNLCQKDLDNLKNWKTHLTSDLAAELTPRGVHELTFIAKKIKEAFPALFESPSKDLFTFQCSDTNRTRDSALAFTNELLGTNFSTLEGNNITKDDKFLRLYKHCSNYEDSVKTPSLLKETKLFKSSALWQKITARISVRLGFLMQMSYENITLMYDICSYENAWHKNIRPPFCAAFTTEDLKVIEYFHDLHSYHTTGHGNSAFIKNMGCPIVRNMMLALSNAENNIEYGPKGKFLFSHSEAVVPTIVKLGLYKDDEEPRLDNYQKMMQKRKWRGAIVDSFASNIIAGLYKCPDKSGSKNVVIINQNERPVVIPQCSCDPCTLNELQNIFQDVFNETECNTNFCELSKPSGASSVYLFHASSRIVICFLLIKVLV